MPDPDLGHLGKILNTCKINREHQKRANKCENLQGQAKLAGTRGTVCAPEYMRRGVRKNSWPACQSCYIIDIGQPQQTFISIIERGEREARST
ncbi:hypothetical protein PGT21_007532 [Puccinia graminis f. sp. tritici]|uniref:Uncharacterized protein n=1 Tax=Puccinia graminis f. sp. tritici TaxID=56615 RepID=A0A5B0NIQ7_PUCGR|nr:hypothetical protein PGT21_007532 [Puccinia graminis f. sp. tritici]